MVKNGICASFLGRTDHAPEPRLAIMKDVTRRASSLGIEWPTLLVLIACYLVWILALWFVAERSVALSILLVGLAIAQHSSLQHEVLHGHPTRSQWLNEALVFPSLILWVPYLRFKATHLAHHKDANLTDPYDDPESNYLDQSDWARLCVMRKALFAANNTLLGRMVIGPVIGQFLFMRTDWQAMRRGEQGVLRDWLLHIPAAFVVLVVVAVSPLPLWAYLLASYLGAAILKIRTFLEHQAHDKSRARTVVVEDRGPLALLFLNNNYHVVHHMHPKLAWYELPAVFRARRARYLGCNEGYYFRSYGQIIRRFFLRAKDPVTHPLWSREP